MSRRDTERERADRSSRAQPQSSRQEWPRKNEYFVPKDGIDREVITADICRYLGNDALVRPGTYENPQTRVAQQGYFINAYRNLTTEMIADLKADSERWDLERRQTASVLKPQNGISRNSNSLLRNSNAPVAEYRSSQIHQSRQYYGPTTGVTPQTTTGYPQGYQQPPTTGVHPQVYDSAQYQASAYAQPAQGRNTAAGGYIPTTQAYTSQEQYYVGANMELDPQSRTDRGASNIPRTNPVSTQAYAATPNYQQADRSGYYQPSPVSTQSGYQQPQDAFYGRVAAGYETPAPDDMYDQRYQQDSRVPTYQDTSAYSQVSMAPATTTTATAPSTHRTHGERESRESRDTRDPRDRHRRR